MRAFRRARWHSIVVRTLRIVFPVCAVATAALYLLPEGNSIEIKGVRVSAKNIDLSGSNLKMRDPQFDGFTDEDGRYNVRAKWARQDPGDKNIVELEKIEANLTEVDNDWAKLVSNEGTYWVKQNRLRLKRSISIETSSGLKAKLRVADVFVKQKRIVSTAPVEVSMPTGVVTADSLELLTDARRATFKKNVVAHLTPPPKEESEAGTDEKAQAQVKAKAAAPPVAIGDGPVDITSNVLEIVDEEKKALFTGNVRAVQTGSTLTAGALEVTYAGAPAGEALDPAAGSTDVTRIEARQNVEITMTDGRKAAGDTSIYDRAAGTMTLIGNVSVGDGESLITGERLEMDIEGRITRFPPIARVRAHLAAAQQDAPGGASGKGKAARKDVTGAQSGGSPSIGESFTGFASDSSGATDIEADELEVREGKGEAIFRGDVIAVRGEHEIRSEVVEVAFDQGAAGGTAAQGATGNVTRINATGRVVVKAPDNQVSTSDWLVYDAAAQSITIGGNVVVSQGKNVIKGEKLIIDLETGESHFETEAVADTGVTVGKRRVQMLIDRAQKTFENATGSNGSGTGQ